MPKFAKGNNSLKSNNLFLNFLHVICLISSISWPRLKLLAVIVFEIS